MTALIDDPSRVCTNPFIVWGNALLADPPAALSDILSGRGARGTQQRAEPEDFLADLLAHPTWRDDRVQLTEGLDAALLNWFKAWFEWSPARISRFGVRAYATRVSDALRVAARLPLKGTASDLISNQVTWDDRFRGLRWPGDIDLLRQFNLLLAQHQTDARFVSRWFAACDEAAWGSPFWQSSLNTGLIGLRKLPVTADAEPEMRVAAALVRFAVLALKRGMGGLQAQAAFRRRVAALTVLYPRHDGHWQEVWERELGSLPRKRREESSTIRTHWLDHVLTPGGADGRSRPDGGQRAADGAAEGRVALPDRDRRTGIMGALSRARSLDENLWRQTRELIRDHWVYASGSGESHFAVHTTHDLGDRLLRLDPDPSRLAEVHAWTLQAIEAEPENAYLWDLWAKVLCALGQDDAALSVRWESVRRFPDNYVLRSSLGGSLQGQARIPLAESLLRETIRDFPRNAVCRTMLAELLARTEREDEAELLLRETIRNFPHDVIGRHVLVTMLWRQGRREKAECEFAALEALDPDDPSVQSLAKMMAATPLEEAPAVPGGDHAGEHGTASDGQSPPLLDPWMVRERVVEPTTIEAHPALLAYLERLSDRASWLESYFASPEGTGRSGALPGSSAADEINSEVELVAAHRAGVLEGPEGRERLRVWASVQPSSYSARLLLAWKGQEGNGLDREAMLEIRKEYPEHRRWNEWLCYGFTDKKERNRLRNEAKGGAGQPDDALWGGRLGAVYPDLETEDPGNEDIARYDPVALRRLLEDVAFAGAGRAFPSIPVS